MVRTGSLVVPCITAARAGVSAQLDDSRRASSLKIKDLSEAGLRIRKSQAPAHRPGQKLSRCSSWESGEASRPN